LRVLQQGTIITDEPANTGDSEGAIKKLAISHNNVSMICGTEKGDLQLRNFPPRASTSATPVPTIDTTTSQADALKQGRGADIPFIFPAHSSMYHCYCFISDV